VCGSASINIKYRVESMLNRSHTELMLNRSHTELILPGSHVSVNQ